ncbi:MAG TPA: hypothetical protein VF816_12235 [Rhodocyclaceae bacterium]
MKPQHVLLALLASGTAASAAAQGLGRLFFTPEQRRLLDAGRDQDDAQPSAAVLRFDGFARRGSGEPAVWMNGRLLPAAPAGSSPLNVGEAADLASGERHDLLPRGSVRPAHAR